VKQTIICLLQKSKQKDPTFNTEKFYGQINIIDAKKFIFFANSYTFNLFLFFIQSLPMELNKLLHPKKNFTLLKVLLFSPVIL
jgi:hypothetical protein